MTIYIAAFALSILFAELGMRTTAYKNGKTTVAVLFSMFPVWFLAAFRYFVGTDYESYRNAFYYLGRGADNYMEWLYKWLNRIIYSLGGNYVWLFAVCAFIFLILVYFHIFEYSPYPSLSIFLLLASTYFFMFLNGMRQMIGCAILLYSMRYIDKEKPIPFFALVILAGGFHKTCYLFAILYFLRKFRLTPIRAFLIALTAFLFTDPIVFLMKKIMTTMEYESYVESAFGISKARFAVELVILLFASLYYHKDKFYGLVYLSNFFAAYFMTLGNSFGYAHRLLYTFGLSAITLLPMAIHRISQQKVRIFAISATVICYCGFCYYLTVYRGTHEVIPYRFVFPYL